MFELLATVGEYGHRGWGYGFGFIFPLLFWVLIIGAIFFFGRRRHAWHHDWHGYQSGESVLAERYAKGEISEEEYRQRKSVLQEGRERRR